MHIQPRRQELSKILGTLSFYSVDTKKITIQKALLIDRGITC